MDLVIFDIDGTLTQSMDVDTRCFARALREVLDLPSVDTDWARYRHVTDVGIAAEIFEHHRQRKPVPAELEPIRQRHVELLAEALRNDENACRPMPGVMRMLKQLRQEPWVQLALATGAWRESASLKLHHARIDVWDLVVATSDDAHSRTEIMELAHQRAKERYGVMNFSSITSVGDAVWDVKAAREAGYRFIGIGCGAAAEHLRREGATMIFDDFTGGFLPALCQGS